MSAPKISIIIPIRNEEAHIAACLDSVFSQDYPQELIEVILADGMSTDRTREIVRGYQKDHPALKLLDNPGKIAPTALNIAIKASAAAVIVRLDAHSTYPRDYVRRCVALLESTGAGNAGGCFFNVPNGDGPWARPIARVTSSRFGVGGSAFRTSSKPGFADTVPFGTFRREVFDKLGGFDERLTRTQDWEFNQRLRRAGYKIAFDPSIRIEYRNQATLSGLCHQAYYTGMWNVYLAKLLPYAMARRRFVPAPFALYLLSLAGSGFMPAALRLIWHVPLAAYAALALWFSADRTRPAAENLRTAMTFLCYHATYGTGMLAGVCNLLTGRWRGYLGRPLRP
jgi:glycosyltransferase involved in cell wall biosynthesis